VIISDTAIKRPVLTVVAMVILVVFGIFALSKLEVDEFPAIDAPVVTVLVPYPGAAPDQVERDVVEPLEEQFTALSGIDKVQSTSVDGFATITAIFLCAGICRPPSSTRSSRSSTRTHGRSSPWSSRPRPSPLPS